MVLPAALLLLQVASLLDAPYFVVFTMFAASYNS